MKFIFLLPLIFLFSCSTLSKEQIGALEKFGKGCDSFSRYPSLLLQEIATIRAERGLYYAATLKEPSNHIKELNSLSKGHQADIQLASKCDKSLEILKSYSRSLKLLTTDGKWESRGRELRSLGRGLDSLLLEVNRLKLFTEELPVGIGKSAGAIISYGAERALKSRQHRLARKYILEADTLVSLLVKELVETLQSSNLATLIENEKKGLESDYLLFLSANKERGYNSVKLDREYLLLYERAQKLTSTRGYTVAAANRLSKAHNQLAHSLQKGKDLQELYDSLLLLEETLSKLEKEYKRLLSFFS